MERVKTIKYAITQDTMGIFKEITQNDNAELKDVGKLSDGYFQQIRDVLARTYQGSNIEIEAYLESEINTQLNSAIAKEMTGNPKLTCVCLDRFLLKEIESQFPERFSRIGITREISGRKSARQGCSSPEKQFEQVAQRIGNSSIMIVDDGIFTGGTIEYSIDTLRKFGANGRIVKIVGFIGDGNLTNVKGVPVEIVSPTTALYEWVDIRDFSIFGGKKYESSKSNRVTSAVPYIFPWSDGGGASFDRLGCFFEISKEMIASFQGLVKGYEQSRGRQLVVQDLVRAGFPLPTNKDKNIPISLKMPVTVYLKDCLDLIKKEEERKVLILDMDGTLNQLDGENGGYSGSTLEKTVLARVTTLISEKLTITQDKARILINKGPESEDPLSIYISKRLGITRADYFKYVWGNIDPKEAIRPNNKILELLRTIKNDRPKIKLVLLSSAPKVWVDNVLRFLEIDKNLFEESYSVEDFERKSDAFEMFSQRYLPKNVWSIGDQYETDLEPALTVGINTVSVNDNNMSNRLKKL